MRFCNSEEEVLHAVTTNHLSDKLASFTTVLQDQKFLAKICEGDLIAIEV